MKASVYKTAEGVFTLKTNISPRSMATVSKWPSHISGPNDGRSDFLVGRGAGGLGTSPDLAPINQ